MAKTATTSDPTIYCRKCSYDLRGQVEHRCPECGEPYDPQDPRTFRRGSRRVATRWIRRFAALVMILLLIASVPYACLWYGWQQEQAALGRVVECHGDVRYQYVDVPVLPSLVPDPFADVLLRARGIDEPRRPFGDADLIRLCGCRGLEDIMVDDAPVSDEAVRAVSQLPRLQTLRLCGKGITDASASHLIRCARLEDLRLQDTSLTDAGLAQLCRIPQLRFLQIESPLLTDAGLASLAGARRLETLELLAPAIGDKGFTTLSGLSGLSRLRLLRVRANGYTYTGALRLQQTLDCKIDVGRYYGPGSMYALPPIKQTNSPSIRANRVPVMIIRLLPWLLLSLALFFISALRVLRGPVPGAVCPKKVKTKNER